MWYLYMLGLRLGTVYKNIMDDSYEFVCGALI